MTVDPKKFFEPGTLKSLSDLGMTLEMDVHQIGVSKSLDTVVTIRAPNNGGACTVSLVYRDFCLGFSAPRHPIQDQARGRRYTGKGWRDRLVFDARKALETVLGPFGNP